MDKSKTHIIFATIHALGIYIYPGIYIYIYIPRYDNRLFVLLTVLVKGKTSGGGIGLG